MILAVAKGAAANRFHLSFDPLVSPPDSFLNGITPPVTGDPNVAVTWTAVVYHSATVGIIEHDVWICSISTSPGGVAGTQDCLVAPLGTNVFSRMAYAIPYATCQGPDNYVEVMGEFHLIGGAGVGCK